MAGCDVTFGPAALTDLQAAAAGRDVVPADEARQVLAGAAATRAPHASTARANNLRSARDAAVYLLNRARRDRVTPTKADPLALSTATKGARVDDRVYLDLVRAYAAAGRRAEAADTANAFDRRRLLPDGRVLRSRSSRGRSARRSAWFATCTKPDSSSG